VRDRRVGSVITEQPGKRAKVRDDLSSRCETGGSIPVTYHLCLFDAIVLLVMVW